MYPLTGRCPCRSLAASSTDLAWRSAFSFTTKKGTPRSDTSVVGAVFDPMNRPEAFIEVSAAV